MKRTRLLIVATVFAYGRLEAQGVAISPDNSNPHASAMLEVKSTSRGMLLPRMTEAQRNAIASPATGLIIFQTDGRKGLYVYDVSWKPLTDQLGDHLATENLRLGGYRLSNNDTTVGISIDQKGTVMFRTQPPTGEPVYRFSFDPAGAITSNGTVGEGILPAAGAGARFMWYPGKAALRTGELEAGREGQWSEANVGRASVALGLNSGAAGLAAVSMGNGNASTGDYAFSAGSGNQSLANGSVGVGSGNTITGLLGMAIGVNNKVEGRNGVAIGYGVNIAATGNYSLAFGTDVDARNPGSVIMGDRSGISTMATNADNQFMARFAGGFNLYAAGNLSVGVRLAPGSNSWSILSDSARKENFLAADGGNMLARLRPLKMGSWNYKGIPLRHYGPMAQEFFTAYGKDQHGTIGNDTTINQADMEGVMMILIHALEERTQLQKQEIAALKQANAALAGRLTTAEEQARKIDLLLALLNKNEATKALVAEVAASCTSKAAGCCEE